MLVVEASAPSNIALIKYMGKTNELINAPTNSSLSYTLNHLLTTVRLTLREDLATDHWQPLKKEGYLAMELSEKGLARFLKHFKNLKEHWGVEKNFLVESANNFPSDCGLASSASSFAALTMAASQMLQKINPRTEAPSIFEQSQMSQKGSGSSCRSFFGPWCLWFSEGVRPLEFPIGDLAHQVVVVDAQKKMVSSSESHRRVVTSALFEGRPARAEKRSADLIDAFKKLDWAKAHQICWAEFWDMHALFETSDPAFGYMQEGTLKVLRHVSDLWDKNGDGPIVTMDAGANVHLLYRKDQTELMSKVASDLKSFQIYNWMGR